MKELKQLSKWEILFGVGVVLLFVSLMLHVYFKPIYPKSTLDAMKQLTEGKTAYAFFYDKEPMGTRSIKDSDQIIRANEHSLYLHFSVEHNMTPATYSGSTSYGESGDYGHHKEGSARVTWSAEAPASDEEGRVWVDEDTYIVQVADSGQVWRNMTTAEVVSARGSESDLDARLDVELNEDGTLKDALPESGGTMTGNINMGGYRVLMAATPPTSGRELATKSYADSIVGAGGLHAASHTDGTDDIQNATNSQKGLMTAAQATSLEASIIVYQPKNYLSGSVTDGIQEAIDAAHAAGGGTVWLSAGHYTIDVDVDLYSNIIVAGDGWSTVVQATSTSTLDLDLEGDSGIDTSVATATINTSLVDLTTTASAGNFSAGDLVRIGNTSGYNDCSWYIVESTSVSDGYVNFGSNLLMTYDITPTMEIVTPLEGVVIKDISFKNVRVHGNLASENSIENCKFDVTSDEGIFFEYSVNNFITGNTFYDCGDHSIYLSRVTGSYVAGNKFYEVTGAAIYANYGWLNNASNNVIRGSSSRGIRWALNDYGTISNNLIESIVGDAIWLTNTSTSNSIVGNSCPLGVIDNDSTHNRGAGNVYSTCEDCTWN